MSATSGQPEKGRSSRKRRAQFVLTERARRHAEIETALGRRVDDIAQAFRKRRGSA